MAIFSEDNNYNILDLGFDKTLTKNSSLPETSTPQLANVITQGVAASNVVSGDLIANLAQEAGVLFSGKTNFDNVETGYRLGIDPADGLVKFYIGSSVAYLNWTGTTLVILGSITATTGMIGGFDIGSDYIRDSANSFGLASTVTGGDDVRFWAGATYANRATAPFYVTEAGVLVATSATISGYVLGSKGAFGGDGSDGALSVTSGTTTLNASSAKIIKRNYTTGSISAGATLTISNPHASGTILWLKFTGAVTIDGTVTVAAMGADGGAGDTNINGSGDPGTASNYVWVTANHGGRGGTSTGGGNSGAGGGGGGSYTIGTVGSDGAAGTAGGAAGLAVTNWDAFVDPNVFKFFRALSGAGGGGGGYASANGGNGGKGGGCIIIECAGALTFGAASVLSTAGGVGAVGTNHATNPGGGGGGGAGGTILVLYNGTLTDSGVTKTVTGGAGGTGGTGANNGGDGGAGGTGFSLVEANTTFA